MALPVFHAIGTAGTSPVNSITDPTTLSPGTPTGRSVGDLLLCVTCCRSNTATVATPSGYSLVAGFPVRSATASGGTVYVFSRIATATIADAANPVWSGVATGTSGDSAQAVILAYTGSTATLDGTIQSSDLSAQGSTSVIPAFTTGTSNSMVIGIAMKILESAGQTLTIATFTERYERGMTNGSGHIAGIGDIALTGVNSNGSSGTATVTWSATTGARALTVSLGFKSIMPTAASALAETLTFATSAVRNAFASSSLAETLSLVTAAVRNAIAASAIGETFTFVTLAVRNTFAAAAVTETVTFTTAATRIVYAESHMNLTNTLTSSADRTAIAAYALVIDVDITTSGQRITYGTATLDLAFTFTTSATVTPVTPAVIPGSVTGTITHPDRGDLTHALAGRVTEAGRGRLTHPGNGTLTKASHP